MIGLELTVVPLIGKNEFGIDSNALILSFIGSFGLVKAILNLYARSLAEKIGRKKVLTIGWLFGVPVPFMLLAAALQAAKLRPRIWDASTKFAG